MPNYAYDCKKCNREWEAFHHIDDRNNEHCAICGEPAHQNIGKFSNGIHVFRPFISQEMSETDMLITSKRQHKEELKKRGLSCRAY